jgi:hypothetical protein
MKAAFRRCNGSLSVAISLSTLALAATAFAGPDWDEAGIDAGSTLDTAQEITMSGALNSISGSLTGLALTGEGDFQDCFLMRVTNPTIFSISAGPRGTGQSQVDPMLFLFRVDEFGGGKVAKAVLANNDGFAGSVGSKLGPTSTDGQTTILNQPGLYLIAIAGFGSQPVNALGERIFSQSFLEAGVIGGPANQISGDYLLNGWSAPGSYGDYVMTVQGISGVPAPGAIALLALGGLARRRAPR